MDQCGALVRETSGALAPSHRLLHYDGSVAKIVDSRWLVEHRELPVGWCLDELERRRVGGGRVIYHGHK